MEEECHAPRSMWRAVLVGCLLIPVNIAWLVQVEYVRYSDNVSTSSLFFNALTLLLVFTGINRLVSAWKPRWALRRPELLLVYVMLVVSTGLAGHDQLTILFATLSYPMGRANPVNGWETTLIPLIPAHLLPQSGEAVKAMYHGQSTLYTWEHIRAWISPVLWWSAFTAAAVWVMLCLSAIFRRQWEAERLSYPMAEIALQLTDPRSGILRNRLFWLAFSLAVVIRCLVFAHILYPSIPELPVGVRYYHLSTSMPWLAASGIGGGIPVQFFPFAIGLCFFLPAHLSFSIWFFILLTRLELVVAAMAGYTDFGQFPYILEQSAGGAIGLGLMVIWAARRHLLAVGRHALGMERMDDSNEPMGYRTAVWGGLAGFCLLVGFWVYAGMRWQIALALMSILFLFVLVTARLRAEVGIPTIDLYMVGGDTLLRSLGGDAVFNRRETAVVGLMYWLTRTHRQLPMSSQVDGLEIARRSGMRMSAMSRAMMLAAVVSVIAVFWVLLHVVYSMGYDSARFFVSIHEWLGGPPWWEAGAALQSPRPETPARSGAYGAGALIAMFLSMLRLRFPGLPLHPVGFIAGGCVGVSRFLAPMFVAWLCKSSILRFGGMRLYVQAVPFFLGLIAGEFATGFAVTLFGLLGVQFPPSSGIGGL